MFNKENWDPIGKTVLLYSGGVDSWIISKLTKPDIKLFFDINTPSSNAEKERLASDVVVDNSLHGLGDLELSGNFIVPLRNLYFIARAAEYGDHIILGTNKTDRHNDKTIDFAEHVERLLNYYYGPSKDNFLKERHITVDFSFKSYDRAELCKMYLESGGLVEVALNESFSCYTPIKDYFRDSMVECHNCRPCFRKMMGFWVNNVKIPKEYLKLFVPYISEKLKEYEKGWGDRYYTKDQYMKVLLEAGR